MGYEGTIWRPPSEAKSLIIQATVGCSWNACTFCGNYRDRKFRVKSLDEIKRSIKLAKMLYGSYVRRVFLADGNALVMPTDLMIEVLDLLKKEFPMLERVSCYGGPRDSLGKSLSELKELYEHGLKLVYLGVESGDDVVLKKVNKGVNSSQMIEACRKIIDSGIKLSVTVILGLGGRERSHQHAVETARVLNAIDPQYLAPLTLMIVPGTPLHREYLKGAFKPLTPLETLIELKTMIERLELTNCIFRCNHASNYLAIGGTLPDDKEDMVELLSKVIEKISSRPELEKKMLRPEYLRAL
ncbi:MAG: radical SAM protein [Thermoprotei archaeon]|nr:MAG: radical SAM protein [Thermoprotei archaeon]RLF19753.1 MAG: radical SAM protein [Thermoprotei archaeon]